MARIIPANIMRFPRPTISGSGAVSTPSSGGGEGGPSWLATLAEFPTWTQIAKGSGSGFTSGAKLASVIQSPNSSNPPGGWGHANAVLDAFTGAAVDQIRKEYIIAAGGGHGDGANNSAYALALADEVPGWRRLTDCTPDSALGDLTGEHDGKFADGRPRAMHASNICWAGGEGVTTPRVWFPMMSSVTSGQGGHADWVLSFNRESLGAAATPLPWTSSNIGPWTFWGSSNQNTNTYGFGGCVYDPVSKKLIAVANASGSFGVWWQKVDVTGPNEGESTAYHNDTTVNCNVCWLTICPELRIVVAGDADGNRVCVLNIDSNTWSVPTQSGTPYTPRTAGCYVGAVYSPASKTIILADPKQTGSTYYKLQVPTSGGSYNPSGTWQWSSATWTGGPTIAGGHYVNDSSSEWTSSKLNKVDDLDGNGTSLLVLATNINGPTFVAKIPAGGL